MEKWTRIQNFNPKLFLSKRNTRCGDKQAESERMQTSNWPYLGYVPWAVTNLWHLLLLYCAYRQEPSMVVRWEGLTTADWNRYRYSYPSIGLRVGSPMEELRGGLKELKVIASPPGGGGERPRVSTNLGPSKLPETEPPTKEHTHTQAGPRSLHICSRGLPCLASVRECT
jgi:hypothetical protein